MLEGTPYWSFSHCYLQNYQLFNTMFQISFILHRTNIVRFKSAADSNCLGLGIVIRRFFREYILSVYFRRFQENHYICFVKNKSFRVRRIVINMILFYDLQRHFYE